MKHKMKRVAVLVMAMIMLSFALVGCSNTIDSSATITTINEQEIPAGVANFFMRLSQAQVETYYAPMMGTTGDQIWDITIDQQTGATYEDMIREDIIRSFENLFIMAQQADTYGVALSEEDHAKIDEVVNTFVAANTPENLQLVSGEAEYVRAYLEIVKITRMMDPLMREGVDTNVPDDMARQKAMEWVFFPFTTPDETGTNVPMTEEQRDEARAMATQFRSDVVAADNDMYAPEIVSNTPDGESTADPESDVFTVQVRNATFDETSRVVPVEVINAAWAMNAGEVSDVLEHEGGLYVVKLTSELDREATDAKAQSIIDERKQEQFDAKLTEWRDAAVIDRNDRLWNRIRFDRLGVAILQFSPEGDSASEDASTPEEDSAPADENTDAPAE